MYIAEYAIDDLRDDPALVSKLHSLLAVSNPDVLAYAAQLGDGHVIREFLKDAPNEVCTNTVTVTLLIIGYCIMCIHTGQQNSQF